VLSSGGHIAGIVNPPSPKSWYEAAGQAFATAPDWRDAAIRHGGSWWEDWAVWAAERAGAAGPAPPMGSDRYPVLGDAPGTYIHG
jgi:polyhydroxyalkanoate synthase